MVDNYYSPMLFQIPTPKIHSSTQRNAVPATLLLIKNIQNETSQRLLSVLFDSGSTKTMIHKRCLPPRAKPNILPERQKMNTIVGQYYAQEEVTMEDVVLPEFDRNKHIQKQKALVFEQPCRYDLILGRDIYR